MRGKLERIAPQVLRVEDRPEWALTDQLRDALALAEDARVHKMQPEEAARQTVIGGNRRYSPESIDLARVLQQAPNKAAAAFRRYANDEAMSREGSQSSMFCSANACGSVCGRLRRPAACLHRWTRGQKTAKANAKLSANLGDLATALREKVPEELGDEPRENYSGLGSDERASWCETSASSKKPARGRMRPRYGRLRPARRPPRWCAPACQRSPRRSERMARQLRHSGKRSSRAACRDCGSGGAISRDRLGESGQKRGSRISWARIRVASRAW